MFGKGDGTFGEERLFGTRYESESVLAADFNGDGKLDLTAADSLLLGNGDGSFQARFDYAVLGTVNAAAFTDFNHDGNIDMAVVGFCNSNNCTGGTVSILTGDGNGNFAAPASYAVGSGSSAIAFGDFNKDGVQDVVTGNFTTGSSNTLEISVLLGNSDGTFQTSTDYPGAELTNTTGGVPPNEASIAVADLNGDGNPDIVATAFGLGLIAWLGNGDGTFQQAVQYTDVGGGSSALVLGDFNGDGKPDVAVANGTRFRRAGLNVCDGTTVSLLLGQGDGTFAPPASYEAGFAPESLAVGDFNGDGKLDLVVVGNWQDGQWCPLNQVSVSILFGNGDGTFQKHIDSWIEAMYRVPDLRISLAVGDFNLDGSLDVVVGTGDYKTGSVEVLYGDGDGTLQGSNGGQIGGYPGPIAVGDFNKDGRPDLATANWGTSTVSLLRNIQEPDFYMQSTGIGTMTAGQSATSLVTIKSILGYSDSVTLSCYVSMDYYLPETYSTSCSVTPATVQLAANGTATSTLTINTSVSAAATNHTPFGKYGRMRYAFWLSISGLAFATVCTTRIRKKKLAVLFAGTLLASMLFLPACGGSGGGSGTSGSGGGGDGGSNPPATYSVEVAATSGNLVRVTGFMLTVQ